MDEEVMILKQSGLSVTGMVERVVAAPALQTNSVFDYLWSLNMSEIDIYTLVSKCFVFQSEYVIKKLMTVKFPASLIIIFIKRSKLGLTELMLEFLSMNSPSGTDIAYLLYDTPQFLTDGVFELFKRCVRSYHEVMVVLDNNYKVLSEEQKESLTNLCFELASNSEEDNVVPVLR